MVKTKSKEEIKKILIVEDDVGNALSAHRAIQNRGYMPDHAFDLEDALEKLDSQTHAGIITDMVFPEKGRKRDPYLEPEEPDAALEYIQERFEDIHESPQFFTNISRFIHNKRERVWISERRKQELEKKVEEIASSKLLEQFVDALHPCGTLTEQTHNRKRKYYAQGYTGVLGNYVIQKAKEKHVPVIPVSSLNHNQTTLLFLLDKEIITLKEIEEHMGYYKGEYRGRMDVFPAVKRLKKNNRYLMELVGKRDITKALKYMPEFKNMKPDKAPDKKYLDRITLDGITGESDIPFIFNRAIMIHGYAKERPIYDLAIDMIEGRIQDTRPYDIIDKK